MTRLSPLRETKCLPPCLRLIGIRQVIALKGFESCSQDPEGLQISLRRIAAFQAEEPGRRSRISEFEAWNDTAGVLRLTVAGRPGKR
jgi:hypothetical protein